MQGFQNGEFDINALRDKLKDVNVRELREAVRNIDVNELKEKIMLELGNSDLTEKQKAYVEQLIDSELFLTILSPEIKLVLGEEVNSSIFMLKAAFGILYKKSVMFCYSISPEIYDAMNYPYV